MRPPVSPQPTWPCLLIATLLLASSLLSSCSFRADSWTSSNPRGLETASFRGFHGREVHRVAAKEGDLLFVSGSASLHGGELSFAVQKGGRTLWRRSFFATNASAQVQLPVAETGEYAVVVVGKNADGAYRVSYGSAPPKPIEVRSSRNIELFGLLMQLDLGPDVLANSDIVELDGRKGRWRDWYRVVVRNYEKFRAHADGPMMKLYHQYGRRGFYNDFFIALLLQVDEVPRAKIRPDTDPEVLLAFSKNRNRAEAEKAASEFLDALNAFYGETGFDTYLAENKPAYEQMIAEVRKHLPPDLFIPTMESFYRKSFNQYCLVPSLNIPTSMGFGKTHHASGRVFNVFGPLSFQELDRRPPLLGFDHPDKVLNLSVHEFGHSFVNPAVDGIAPDLIKRTEHLFDPIRDAMTKQSYPSWRISLYEHFVRAGEVIIARKLGNTEVADRILGESAGKGFLYLPMIVEQLEKYDRNEFPGANYDDVVQLIVDALRPVNKP